VDNRIKKEMISYYNERAEEYDDLYIGEGHFTLDPDIYLKDVTKVSEMASGFGNGHLIDIACGSGFWMLSYARNCSRITLLDQSEKMLKECKKRVEKLRLINLVNFIQGDFLEVMLEDSTFDSALVGFLLSHLTIEQEKFFFLKLKRILKSNGQLMIIDGAWNDERQKYTKRESIQERVLNDGRRFKIYKRYFEKSDLEGMAHRYNFKIKSCYVGTAFIAVILERV
jgi:ubiquinone/menaquinone biosynthesis C-methylase UbiE